MDRALRRKRPLIPKRLAKRSSVEKLHGEVIHPVLGRTVVVDADGVGVFEAGADLGLVKEALAKLAARVRHVERLDGDAPAQRLLDALVDSAHAAAVDQPNDPEGHGARR